MVDAPHTLAWQPRREGVRVPWGTQQLDLVLPADWPVFDARPAAAPQPADSLAQQCESAMSSPLRSPALRQIARDLAAGGRPIRVAIVVDDDTRPTPADQILPIVLDHLGAGRQIPDDRIEIHFAGGMHTPMTRVQMIAKIGPALVERFACFNNPFCQPSQQRFLGRTRHNIAVHLSARVADANLRILVGSVSAHLQAGFSGGYKLLFPGMAGLATIKQLHLRGTERFRQLIGLPADHNPMRQEIDRLGEWLDGTTFALTLLPGESATQPLAVAAGDPVAVQRTLAEQAVARYGVHVPGPADLVVCNSHPRDNDLWQGFKCIANTLFAAREGGLIVATIKADRGANGMKLPRWTLKAKTVRTILKLTGRDGFLHLLARLLPQVNDEARFFVRFGLGTIRRNDLLIYSPTLAAESVRFPGIELFDTLPAVWKRAGELLAGRTPNVTVFSQGGICYPM